MERDKKEKLDAFWDISQLVPPKKNKEISHSKRITLASVTVKGDRDDANTDVNRTSERQKLHLAPRAEMAREKKEKLCYENFSPLIKKVEICPLNSSYHYYEFFCKNAQAYYHIHGKACERVPFFSYVAQYSQMNRDQLNWYFWWRENARKSVFLDTDISYIYLYIYEIINLGELIDIQKALRSLIEIWHHYRDIYPALNKALGEWVCDYSLLNRIPIAFPNSMITPDMINACSFHEAFYGIDPKDNQSVSDFLMLCCGGYNYRKSKFYAENQPIYDEILLGCLSRLSPLLMVWNKPREENVKHMSKVAFVGALCSYRIRKHIEVDYIPASTGDLKLLVTSVLNYAENMLRSYLGIRSRLGYAELPCEIKDEIDRFFAECLGQRRTPIESRPEYERLYEAKTEEFSFEKALDIERSSWSITEELVDGFSDLASAETQQFDYIEPQIAKEEAKKGEQDQETQEPIMEFLKEICEYKDFFDAIVSRDMVRQREFCRKKGIFSESAVDFINEKAADILGDILLEEGDSGYEIIEDYREMFDTEGPYASSK